MKTKIRPANPADVPGLFHIRTSVRENHLNREQLASLGITEASIAEMISTAPCAWVAVSGDKVVGFSMIDSAEGSLFAAFVLPSHEGMGIGAKLVDAAENELFRHHSEIWLETAENSRAAGFYRHLGWSNEIKVEDDQIRLTNAPLMSSAGRRMGSPMGASASSPIAAVIHIPAESRQPQY